MQTVVTTCKGRFTHLVQALPRFADEFDAVVVVDWDCPDNTADRVSEMRARNPERFERVWPVRPIGRHELFHKTRALNYGAACAIANGATQLVFLDADTLVDPGLGEACGELARDDIGITGPKTAKRSSLIGFLACSREAFELVNGFDERFTGWGYEDQDMRLRLLTDGGCRPVWLPERYFWAIDHHNGLRGQFQPDTIASSNARNRRMFLDALRARAGEHWSKELSEALPYR